jgi:hypothetical protein
MYLMLAFHTNRVVKLIKALILEVNDWDGGKEICAEEDRNALVEKWMISRQNTININFVPELKLKKSKTPSTTSNVDETAEKKKAERKIMNDGLEILKILISEEVLMELVSSEDIDWRFWMRPCNITFKPLLGKDHKPLKTGKDAIGNDQDWGVEHANMVARVRDIPLCEIYVERASLGQIDIGLSFDASFELNHWCLSLVYYIVSDEDWKDAER